MTTEISFWEAFGIFGAVSSIISLYISSPGWKSKAVHIAYSLLMVGMVIWFMSYQAEVKESMAELERIKRIEKQAEFLVGKIDLGTSGNMAGYVQAVLAFLEKHRDIYPETYERAKTLCENAGCTDVGTSKGNDTMDHFSRMQEASSSMRMLIKGVSTLGEK